MKALAIVLNIIIPGVGSFVIGRIGSGVGQILIWGIGALIIFFTLGFGVFIGLPMMIGAWIWGLVTAIGSGPQVIQVNVSDNRRPDNGSQLP